MELTEEQYMMQIRNKLNKIFPPKKVSSTMIQLQDKLKDRMFSDCFEVYKNNPVPFSEVYNTYVKWAHKNNCFPDTKNTFSRYLSAKGIRRERTSVNGIQCQCIIGIRIKPDPSLDSTSSLPLSQEASATNK